MKVLVTGATGFIGSAIVRALGARGDEVVVLTRNAGRAREALGDGVTCVTGEIESAGAWCEALGGVDGVVHLAGEPIAAKRWDARRKQVIRDSRVEGTRVLVEAIEALPAERRPRVLVSASGVDYYPYVADMPSGFDDDEVKETDGPGDDFLSRLCRDWEEEAARAESLGVRVVRMRTGLVLGPGGALARMTGPFRFFVGGRLGSGRQWVSWIHLDDVVAAYLAALSDDRYRGPVNLVADSTRAADLARALGAALHRPSWLPVPAFALRAAVGPLAEYLLHGRRVIPATLHALAFAFHHPDLPAALAASLRRGKNGDGP